MGSRGNHSFDVGGIRLDRPFKLRRLGHFGYYANDMAASLRFYKDLLGFQITDTIDFAPRARDPKALEGLGEVPWFLHALWHGSSRLCSFPLQSAKSYRLPKFDDRWCYYEPDYMAGRQPTRGA